MAKKIYFLLLIGFLFTGLSTGLCFGKTPAQNQNKQESSMRDVIIQQIKAKQDLYASQLKQLNKKIMDLEKKKQSEKEIKKRDDIEAEINSSVIFLAAIQEKINAAQLQIADYEKRQEEIDLAIDLELELGTDKKYQVRKRTREEISASSKESQETEAGHTEYSISAHDELQINVYGEPDLTKTVRVAVDGTISYPLLGKVKVDGLTAQGLEDKLSKLFKDGGFIVNPQVSVFVERFSTVSILGEARNPGSYELKGRLSIMDAIAQAGGFNIDADINNVKILRVEDGQQKTISVNLGDVKKGMEGVEIALKPNDTIFVEKIGKVTVLGEVARPGTFELKDKLAVLEAIAMAGGFTNIAAINGTRIIREPQPGAKKKVIKINVTDVISRGKREMDLELLAGDIVYVPESLF